MIVLKYNHCYLRLIGIGSKYPHKFGLFWKMVSCTVFVFGLLIVMLGGSTFYAYQNMYQLTLALRAILIIFASLQCSGSYISIGLEMARIDELEQRIQDFVDKVPKDEMHYYSETEDKCRRFTKYLSVGYVIDAAALFSAAFLFSFYCMSVCNFDTSTWLLPYNLYVPFDTSTISGWYMLWIIECYIGLVYSLSVTCLIAYFMCYCWYIVTICNHFNSLVLSFNKNILNNDKIGNSNQLNVMRLKLNGMVELHNNAYEIAKMLGDICSGTIFWMLSCNIVFFACALYQLEHTISSMNIMILYDFLCVIVSLAWPFGLCFGATQASTAGFSTGEIIYDTEWYSFPLEIQKYLPMMLARSQHEIIFDGSNIVGCNLQKFIQMNRSTSSFYLMFRSLGSH